MVFGFNNSGRVTTLASRSIHPITQNNANMCSFLMMFLLLVISYVKGKERFRSASFELCHKLIYDFFDTLDFIYPKGIFPGKDQALIHFPEIGV